MSSSPMDCCVLLLALITCAAPTYSKFDEETSIKLIRQVDESMRDLNPDPAGGFIAHGHEGHVEKDNRDSLFTNEWVVEITGGPLSAIRLANEMGYEITGQLPGFPDVYRLHKTDHPLRNSQHSALLTRSLSGDVRVIWAEQQFAKRRQKREFLPLDSEEPRSIHWSNDPDQPLRRVKRSDEEEEEQAEQEAALKRTKREDSKVSPPKDPIRFNDELWGHQWYMHDTRTRADLPRLDLHVLPVYQMGLSGKGVNVLVLDDGLEFNHTDIRNNYNPDISYDINDDDGNPSPRYDKNFINSHGTRCAGEIAMEANNGKCGVGVAFKSRIGGIRMLDGTVSDRVEATSLNFALDQVDIYSASWGPTDDGRTVEGPGRLARQAFYKGITQGRQGRGAIYVWAAGNGGGRGDNCNCDGYVSSIYTVSIGSASEQGVFPWYGEKCASTMAVTYSSGAYTDQKVATIDLGDKCTMDHTGTSAAVPLAAGIIALALEANPELTWRDVQHILVWTSEQDPLKDNDGWSTNSAGFRFNTRFGFGLMNAASYVKSAISWTTVPEKAVCIIQLSSTESMSLTSTTPAKLVFSTDGCKGTSNEVNYVEHIELVATIEYPYRGALQIDLVSPSGTKTQVLTPREKDVSTMGFVNWPFMSVHTWGETSQGDWIAIVSDKLSTVARKGQVSNATLIIHGTAALPSYRKNGPRVYDDSFSKFDRQQLVAEIQAQDRSVNVAKLRDSNPSITWSDLIGFKLVRNLIGN